MAERAHPHASPPRTGDAKTTTSPPDNRLTAKPTPSAPAKPTTRPGTYIVKVPKDQIYRVPHPENARLFQRYTSRNRKNHRSRCCCCLCWFIGLIFIFIVLLGIAAGVLYLVFRPEAPDYTVDGIAIKGIDLTSTTEISPEFDVAVRANNRNDKIGIYYENGSSVEVYYNDDVRLSNGALPAFYQPPENVTVFEMALKGSNEVLRSTDRSLLLEEQAKGSVPLKLKLTAPVKLKVGSATTWKITVKVNCDVTVNKLTEQAEIVSKSCDYRACLVTSVRDGVFGCRNYWF